MPLATTREITILLIEDDEEDYILLKKVLAKVPHNRYLVRWEQQPEQGLAHMRQEDHDICLVDYRLGASSGLELLKEARQCGYGRPIIMLTGAGSGDIDIQALQAGADDDITKDLLQGELLHRLIRYAIERRKAEQERERLIRDQLIRDERDARRNEFISMVVHELKTPLSSLKGYSQLLGRRYQRVGDTQGMQLASRMDQQVNRLTGLINDLLDVNRSEAGKLQLRESTFPFDELVADTVTDIQLTTERHTIVIKGHARDQSGQTASAQPGADQPPYQCHQVCPRIRNNPGQALIRQPISHGFVQDFGPGIAREYQSRVFEPFYRIETTRAASGLGLGLAIAADLIKRHQGEIWVESEQGQGTTFCFTLPLGQQQADES